MLGKIRFVQIHCFFKCLDFNHLQFLENPCSEIFVSGKTEVSKQVYDVKDRRQFFSNLFVKQTNLNHGGKAPERLCMFRARLKPGWVGVVGFSLHF